MLARRPRRGGGIGGARGIYRGCAASGDARSPYILESASDKEHHFKCMKPELGKVVIIGGRSQLGRLFGNLFSLSGYRVETLGQADWPRADGSSPAPGW